jgi:peptide/nickel transport system permease protein
MKLADVWSALRHDSLAMFGGLMMVIFIVVAVIGPSITPYDPDEIIRDDNGAVKLLVAPNSDHWFGTTALGRDVFSQVLVGTRTALVVGLWAAVVATAIGTMLGLIAGYFGTTADHIISRLVEITYSIPFEPLAIILLALINPSILTLVLAISLVAWRQPTRVVRNQVLTMRNSAFVKSARVAGASRMWIVLRHIAPLILPVAFVYIPVGFGHAILAEASISFLGFGDPDSISWGGVLRNAFESGAFDRGWWWIVTPGAFITVATASMFFITRPFEEVVNPRLRRDR